MRDDVVEFAEIRGQIHHVELLETDVGEVQFIDDFLAACNGRTGEVDSSEAAWVELGPSIAARYFSRTQPRFWVTGSDTWSQTPSRLTTCKSVPGE